jgi:hypothetical protein
MKRVTKDELANALFKTTAALQIAIANLNHGVCGETIGTLTATRISSELLAVKAGGGKLPPTTKVVIPYVLREVYEDKGGNNGLLEVDVVLENGAVSIKPRGYGQCCAEDGFGEPMFMELRHGEPWIVAWADINQEDPSHSFGLNDANESLRKD